MDYSFADVNLNEAQDLKTVPSGEYKVVIVDTEVNEEKYYFLIKLEVEGQDAFTKRVRHFVFFPKPDDDREKKNNKLLGLKRFCQAFGIDQAQLRDPDTFVGKRGTAILKEKDDGQYGLQNEVGSFSAFRG